MHTVILEYYINMKNIPSLILPSSLSRYSSEHKTKIFFLNDTITSWNNPKGLGRSMRHTLDKFYKSTFHSTTNEIMKGKITDGISSEITVWMRKEIKLPKRISLRSGQDKIDPMLSLYCWWYSKRDKNDATLPCHGFSFTIMGCWLA